MEPAGDNGTYFQQVPLYAVHTIEDKTKFSFRGPTQGRQGTMPIWPMARRSCPRIRPGRPTADIDAPIVFVGYGIDAPEYHWNDYAGVES